LILGRVIDATTGSPISSAVVRLASAGAPVGSGVLTGTDGRFVFAPVAAGEFTITAERAGFLDGQYGRRRPTGSGVPFVLRDQERRGDATIQIWPWASISGIVVDEAGRRVPGIPVEAVRRGADDPSGYEGGRAVTDARGEYRIQRLVPGSYAVGAICHAINVPIPANAPMPDLGVTSPGTGTADPTLIVDTARRRVLAVTGPIRRPRDERERAQGFVYVTTFYGGATDLWQAAPLDVKAGQQLSDIDVKLGIKPSVRMTGSVVGPRGPVAEAMIRLLPTDLDPAEVDMSTPDVVAAVSGVDGTFALPPVPRGNYFLDVYRARPAPSLHMPGSGVPRLSDARTSSRDTEGYWSRMSLTVTDRDMPEFLITMRAGLTIAGQTVFQRIPAPADAGSGEPVRLVLEHGTDPPVTSAAIRTDRAGAFEITGIRPGWYVLSATGLPAGWEISSAILGGRDITGRPFELGSHEAGSLTVTLGDRPIEIRGDVLDAQGRLVRDATVVLISSDISGWKSVSKNARNLQALRATAGGYAFRGIAAGEYYLAAVDDSALEGWPAPEVLRRLMNGALRVRFVAGDRRVENLTVRPVR